MGICQTFKKNQQASIQTIQCEQGYFGLLDYRMIRKIAQYLLLDDILNFRLTNSAINELICLKKIRVTKQKLESVENDQISLYLDINIQQIYENIIGIVVIISTKDQGWASVDYSASWVTLSLFNERKDYLTHEMKENQYVIHSNYEANNFTERRAKISDPHQINTSFPKLEPMYIRQDNPNYSFYEPILSQIRRGKYKNIGIVQKCLEPYWECFLQSAEIIIYYLG